MGKLTSVELELVLAYIADLENGEIYKPFLPKEGFSFDAKRIIARLEELRKNLLIARSGTVEMNAKVQEEIANVTHDLKTPIAVILGYVESLEDGVGEDDYLDLIKKRAIEMNEIVLRIIESSREMANAARKEKRVLNARDLFPAVVAKYARLAKGKHIKFVQKKVPRALIAVSEKEIISVMDNLLTNAVKYTNKGKITVSFYSNRKLFYVVVQDTGLGIKKEELPFIFDRFFTMEKARTKGGTGIGLNYVKEVVEAHGGEVHVKSKEGKGSKFVVILPRVEPKRRKPMSEDKKKFLEAFFRIWLFPFFVPYDIMRAIYYGIKEAHNKADYYLHYKDKTLSQ